MKTWLLVSGLILCFVPATSGAVAINEWVSNDISTDDHEFVELCGTPGENLEGLSLVLIEGEGTVTGTVDLVLSLSGYSIGLTGLFVIGDASVSPDLLMGDGWIENGGNNILLVQDVQQAQGVDIDTDNDCVEDLPIGTVVDAVGFGKEGDCITYYGAVPVGPDGTYDPAGGARCEDCTGVWYIICLDGTEPTGPGCLEDDGYMVGYATPGTLNDCFEPTAAEGATWSGVKATYR